MDMREPMPSRSRPATAAATPRISTSDETIRTAREIVRTTEEIVRTSDDAIERLVVTEDDAARALVDAFGPAMEADYLPGKTRLRDAITARFDVSALAAEELCDALERAGRIKFVSGALGSAFWLSAGPVIANDVDDSSSPRARRR